MPRLENENYNGGFFEIGTHPDDFATDTIYSWRQQAPGATRTLIVININPDMHNGRRYIPMYNEIEGIRRTITENVIGDLPPGSPPPVMPWNEASQPNAFEQIATAIRNADTDRRYNR